LTDHIELDVVSARFSRDLLEEVLNRSERREKRTRRLPAHVMVRYVTGVSQFWRGSSVVGDTRVGLGVRDLGVR
jgi:hypothetical protein